MSEKTEIRYGRMRIEGEPALVALYENEQGQKVKLINFSYGELVKFVEGDRVKTNEGDVMIATKVAGWQGSKDFCDKLEVK